MILRAGSGEIIVIRVAWEPAPQAIFVALHESAAGPSMVLPGRPDISAYGQQPALQDPTQRRGWGQGARPRPRLSYVYLFGDGEGIVNFDSEVAHRAFNFGVASWTARRFPVWR
jgi:hypothetical protein